MTDEMQAAVTRYLENGGRVRVIKPQRRWKYGTHSVYNPRKQSAKGIVPRMYRGML